MTPYRLPFIPEPCPIPVVEPVVDRLPAIYTFVVILVAMALAAMRAA